MHPPGLTPTKLARIVAASQPGELMEGKATATDAIFLSADSKPPSDGVLGNRNPWGGSYQTRMQTTSLSATEFTEYKKGYISWMEERLEALKEASNHRQGNLKPADLAHKFCDILKLLNRKAPSFIDKDILERSFDGRQMAVIFSLLDDMIDASVHNSDQGGFTAAFEAVNQLHIAQQDL
jgi:hypothetical protein